MAYYNTYRKIPAYAISGVNLHRINNWIRENVRFGYDDEAPFAECHAKIDRGTLVITMEANEAYFDGEKDIMSDEAFRLTERIIAIALTNP